MPPSSSLRSRASTNSLIPATPRNAPHTPKNQKMGHKTPTEDTSFTDTTNGDAMDLATDSPTAGGTATTDEDAADSEDADKMDVQAPSSDVHNSNSDDIMPDTASNVGKISPAATASWTGAPESSSNEDTTSPVIPHTPHETSMQDDSITPTVDDMRNYDFDGDMSDGDSPNASDLELDDDYGDVDKMSETSDISKGTDDSEGSDDSKDSDDRKIDGVETLRELEYEKELRELGDQGGIDWDDKWFFEYNSEFGCSDYDICGEDGLIKSTHDLDPRNASIAEGTVPDLELPAMTTMLPLRAFTPAQSDSEDSSKSTPTTPLTPEPAILGRSITPRTSSLSSSNDPLLDGDETEDDDDYRIAPAAPLEDPAKSIETPEKQQSKDKKFKPSYQILDESTPSKPKSPAKNKIRLRKFKRFSIDESRPYCFTVKTPGGGYRFKWVFPKGSGREGKQRSGKFDTSLRRSESVSAFLADSPFESSDSGRDSPTFIDWEDAMLQGNTNTGAAITDTIRGRIFAQTHCRPRADSHNMEPVPSFFQKILQMSSQNAAAWTPALDSMDQSLEDALDFDELIDVDECAEPSSQDFLSPLSELAYLSRPVGRYADNQQSPTAAGKHHVTVDQVAAQPTTGSSTYDSLTSPSQPQMSTPFQASNLLAPPFSPISPRKRRLSDRSTDGSRPVSQKKSRVSWSSGISPGQNLAVTNGIDSLRDMSLEPIPPSLMDMTSP